MFMTLMLLNFLTSSIFLFMNHPMSMGLILLIQTILISLITGFMSYSYWFSYILFLIMIGGMLVLFIYMTSLASNEMFSLSMKISLVILLFLIIITMIMITMDWLNFTPLMNNSNLNTMFQNINNNETSISINKIYNMPNNLITIMLINYLLLTLIVVVKITSITGGPLRRQF
uniref:NADH-ubiquinone oxidoreductase chain 6 n=1 Tax=Pogonostoma subtiligrossum TaxID=1343354 RepID=A0A343EZ09_9CARA|nr:NADH dehydrogenase subunit 6 [Pogonostoma subtiligrossum]